MTSLLAKTRKIATCLAVLLSLIWVAESQTEPGAIKPLVLAVQMKAGRPIYKLDGREVEDRPSNSLLRNLTEIVKKRGTKLSVFVVIDVHAPLTEVGKLETALDKVDLTSDRRLFVSDFRNGTMNEIHWDQEAIPLPKD